MNKFTITRFLDEVSEFKSNIAFSPGVVCKGFVHMVTVVDISTFTFFFKIKYNE